MMCKLAKNCLKFATKSNCRTRPDNLKLTKQITNARTGHKFREKSGNSRDHLVRTEGSFRQSQKVVATVIDIEKLSPTVRGITFLVDDGDNDTIFKAGQWVDMTIPQVSTVGGFSICSSPKDFDDHRILEFAVKYADHPPAKWIHEQCHVGATVNLSFGGDFCYDPPADSNEDLLLIAGGVGINPIYSILRHRSDLLKKSDVASKLSSTTILYSAKTREEILFEENIQNICCGMKNASYKFFITQDKKASLSTNFDNYKNFHFGHITTQSLEEATRQFHPRKLVCYICGPPGFIDIIAENLKNLGLPDDDIRYEKWW